MKDLLDRLMAAAPRGPMDFLAVIIIVALVVCAIAFTGSMIRQARQR